MKANISGIIAGIIAGILIGWLIIYLTLPGLMFREDPAGNDFNSTVSKLEETAKDNGWMIPTIHDLQASMKKFGKDVKAVRVFELCHPEYSYEILSRSEERLVTSMMPCRIAVYEKEDGSVWISRMNSGIMAKPMGPVIRSTMSAAAADMEEIIATVLAD